MLNLGFYSGRNMPNIRLTPTMADRIMELLALLLLIGGWVFAFVTHVKGGIEFSKDLWISLGINTFAFLLAAGIAYIPIRFVNFPVRVHEGNMVVQYRYATRFCRVLNIVIQLLCVGGVLYFFHDFYGISPEAIHNMFLAGAGLFLILFLGYYILAIRHR